MFSRIWTQPSTEPYSSKIERLRVALAGADAVIIGAGAGMSTSAGLTYDGERFRRLFSDFEEKCGFHDMYSGGFYPFPTLEEQWAYWSRFIMANRYTDPPKPVYEMLLQLLKDKDYFVITTNVDHCFQKAGIDRHRLFYTQGDYGLWQCSKPCYNKTYDNADVVRQMVEAQGFQITEEGLKSPAGNPPKMSVPTDLIPHCPLCGAPMAMNLRADNTFVEDEGWHRAAQRYENFLRTRQGQRVLFLELGVGYNTPVIIKYPFWQMTAKNPKATYVCVNFGDALCPRDIEKQSICLDADIGDVLSQIAGQPFSPGLGT